MCHNHLSYAYPLFITPLLNQNSTAVNIAAYACFLPRPPTRPVRTGPGLAFAFASDATLVSADSYTRYGLATLEICSVPPIVVSYALTSESGEASPPFRSCRVALVRVQNKEQIGSPDPFYHAYLFIRTTEGYCTTMIRWEAL